MMKKLATGFAALALLASTALAQTVTFNGNGATGFGGPAGLGSLTFNMTGTTVNVTFTNGRTPGEGFNNLLVIYIDSRAGGFTDTSAFTDSTDPHRRGISGFDNGNRALLTFSGGFAADYAIALNSSFAGLWELDDTALFAFRGDLGISPGGGNNNAATYSFSFDLSQIGLGAGDTFNIVTTYLDPNSPWRSNEAIGHGLSGTPVDEFGNFGRNDALATGFATVPEPSTVSLLVGAALLAGWRLRRRRSA
jgi:hypothetical protein